MLAASVFLDARSYRVFEETGPFMQTIFPFADVRSVWLAIEKIHSSAFMNRVFLPRGTRCNKTFA